MSQKPSREVTRMFTYDTLLSLDENSTSIINSMSSLLSQTSRSLFRDLMAAEKSISSLKKEYIRKFGITARHFNSCRVGIEGIIKSQIEIMKQRIQDLQHSIEVVEKQIKTLSSKKRNRLKIHSKKMRLNRLKQKLTNITEDLKNRKIHLCFGGKKLFNAQFDLAQSGYTSHEEWKVDWENSRDNAFFLVGSKDEAAGNQSCTATIQADGKLSLRVRIPDALYKQYGRYLIIPNVYFPYGHDHIVAAIQDCLSRSELKKINPLFGTPISYRFMRKEKGWHVAVSINLPEPKWITDSNRGVIGVDINIDHLAVTELDRFGNPLNSFNFPLVLYGKSTNQTKAIIGDACKKVIELAELTRKDIVIEDLDFTKKRKTLNEFNSSLARTLSSFAYNKIIQTIRSRGFRLGCRVHQVNPSFTSIIGRIKYAAKYGRTTHQAAALCIGRRFYGFSERPPCGQVLIPDGKGRHVNFEVPVRNHRKSEWSHWGAVGRKLQAVHAAQKRAVKPVQRKSSA